MVFNVQRAQVAWPDPTGADALAAKQKAVLEKAGLKPDASSKEISSKITSLSNEIFAMRDAAKNGCARRILRNFSTRYFSTRYAKEYAEYKEKIELQAGLNAIWGLKIAAGK